MPRPHYNTLVLTLIVDLSATEIDSAGYIRKKIGHAKVSPRSDWN